MSPRHFTSIADISSSELSYLVNRAIHHKANVRKGVYNPATPLAGQVVAMLFNKRSTRTRISTEGAVKYLGGHPMFLGKDDIQLGVNETLYDSAKVISSMTSCIVARVGPHSDIQGLAAASRVPVINALCDTYHPLQAVADMITIKESFGEVNGLKVAWVGDANNVLHDLALACVKLGINISAATPKAYPVSQDIIDLVSKAGAETGATLSTTTDPLEAVKNADVIVTDTWISMGQEEEKQLRLKQFAGYQVTQEMAAQGGAKENWKFMHCLPRKQEEVNDEIFYSDRSLVFEEAENRLYSAIACLEGFVVNKGKLIQ
ncbi:ornithine carbamoyltransferase [Sugiyamaella lignohabitans]|uniref:ornithine carbamoyltransferase n=1 Tax=Sugiyamaella lignohabitans TaxID=796027 RepID=A0A167F4Q8_9ASCO|nr:ornithine carbamoyltransferase [Sugiyamaella lignohabitans]ANB14819.1 ornithine carbamoyltransferase [Sugiyamaella lignohabitans]